MSLAPLLVTADWVAERLHDPQIRVVDLRWYLTEPGRGRQEYLEAHVPGAAYMDIDHDLSAPAWHGPGRHPLPAPEHFAGVAARTGISAASHVIIYDAVGGAYATRLWWLLRYFGHDRVSLLDGGWPAWVAGGYATEAGEAQITAALFTPQPNPAMLVYADDVERMRHAPDVLLLDARSAERFEGKNEIMDARAGHIPGARSAPYAGNLSADGTLLPAEALRARYTALGADHARTIVCYCGSGVTATHDLLALELAGFTNTVLYAGSWSDWSSNPERPAATGTED